jgi:Flp pilus assembly protein TadD
MAAAMQPDPTILDTLAEAYYVNGQAEKALDTIRRALLESPKDADHFVRQREKFEAAVKKMEGERGRRGDEGTQ